jgi:hypothetical protein
MPSDVCKDIHRSVIHPSAWHRCSRKSRFSILYNPVPIREKQGFETSQKPRLSHNSAVDAKGRALAHLLVLGALAFSSDVLASSWRGAPTPRTTPSAFGRSRDALTMHWEPYAELWAKLLATDDWSA